MLITTRKTLDKAFTGTGWFATVMLILALLVVLGPIVIRGMGAVLFEETVERRILFLEYFSRGTPTRVWAERECALGARQPIFDAVKSFEAGIAVAHLEDAAKKTYRSYKDEMRLTEGFRSEKAELMLDAARDLRDKFLAVIESYLEAIERVDLSNREIYAADLEELKFLLRRLFGPLPDDPEPALVRDQYGETRWDRAQLVAHQVLYEETYVDADETGMRKAEEVPRVERYRGTAIEPVFGMIENGLEEMMLPRRVFYWQFIIDESVDAHFFGGIWPSVLGTIYLTIGALLFAIPFGIAAAVYLSEYAKKTAFIRIIRSCIDTLAAVPSIVFGLFGLAFFINVVGVSDSKSVLAGALTLALLVLPTVIRASEEAIKAVPNSYREASLGLGASKGRCVLSVVLPAALPGILTGVVISMGRGAGETAPIIFTAAVSVGLPLNAWETLSKPSPALPWTIYNLATEHQLVDEIRHVQYGMVLSLVVIVLLLNATAILMRARMSKRLRG
jgi:phosphate transport system permease protein